MYDIKLSLILLNNLLIFNMKYIRDNLIYGIAGCPKNILETI